MKREELDEIARRMLTHLDEGTTASEKAPMRMDRRAYADPDAFALEKQKLFREHPQLICLSADLAEPGDYLTHDDTGVPILVVRGADGVVRAFLNTCRHRGARVAEGSGRCAGRFVCPYHAWSYDTEGRLAAINAEGSVGEVARDAHGLHALPVCEKHGLVYVRPTPGEPFDVDDLLGELGPQLGGWRFDTLHPAKRRDLSVRTNWKLAMDTFFEGYHFASLHETTIGQLSITNLMTYDRYGRNHRLGFPSKSIASLRDQPESEWDSFQHFQLTYFLFPNVNMLVSPPVVYLFQIYPGERPDEHLTRFHLYSRIPLDTEKRREWAENHYDLIYSVVENEDYKVGAGVQRGISSGLNPYTIFGRNEPTLIHMHASFREAIGRDPAEILRPL